MGWTKADRDKFLKSCNEIENIMPKEVIKVQTTMFEDILETDDPTLKYQKVRFAMKYPILTDNTKGDPTAKQSARFTVQRYMGGDKKGEPIIFKNKAGKDDVMIKSYQDVRITNTTKALQMQITKIMHEKGYTKFRGAIFVTRMEFIFKVSDNAPKYLINELKMGTKISFKDTKPDLDNLEKLVYDAMEEKIVEKSTEKAFIGLLYDNDALIVSKNGIFKRWGIVPGVIVEMEGYI